MRKLLLLLPLIIAGCGEESEINHVQVFQALAPQIAAPDPVSAPVLDVALYVPMPAIVNDDGWTARLKGLPIALNDVVWSGETFIAVGEDGVILTSPDGIDWVQQTSGTRAGLNAVTSYGADIFIVGQDATVLRSTDHGESWTVKHSEDGIDLHAIVINAWQIVAGGRSRHSADAFMMRSENLGDTWAVVESLPQSGHWSTDLVYAGGLFIASTDIPRSTGGTRVWVSVDGKDWQDSVLMDTPTAGLYSVLHDGSKFIVSGSYGAVFMSTDGAYWTQSDTPLEEISYLSSIWTGSELRLAGGITWWYWFVGEPRFGIQDVGLSSHDGGLTWSTFNIDGYFESSGLAWGNGRFVSVGHALANWGEGAIYTSP